MTRLLGPGEPFPDPQVADPRGLVAAGGSLQPARLVQAYRLGLFPWPLLGRGEPILWFSPDPRFVLRPGRVHCSKSLRKVLRRGVFEVRFDTCFRSVVEACAAIPRPGQDGTWITGGMVEAYCRLHRLGFGHSVEVFAAAGEGDEGRGELVGGLYGVALGGMFFGESMFARRSSASKVALVSLARRLERAGFSLIDCQQETEHLALMGAERMQRARFLEILAAAVDDGERWMSKVEKSAL